MKYVDMSTLKYSMYILEKFLHKYKEKQFLPHPWNIPKYDQKDTPESTPPTKIKRIKQISRPIFY